MKLYFVVRTDAAADSGLQRGFGVFDSREDAARMVAQLQGHMRGEFEVYEGAPAES